MFRKYIIPLIALGGVAFAVFTVVWEDKPPPSAPPVSEAPWSPYPTFVAGSGLVEASTENISLGTHVAGIVAKIYVQIGSDVKAGDPLFAIDDRATRADIDTRRAAVQVAETQLGEARYNLALVEPLVAKGVATGDDLIKMRFAAQTAEAQLEQARAELKARETELDRLTVRAPVDGEVLQLKAHLGEFAPVAATAAGQPPLILLGGVTPLNVRVDVDENDAWRVRTGAPATGYLRGNRSIKTPLTFVRFEPYVLPKKSLTGDSTERVDTRVLQVIFSFARGDLPIFVGQQMDVFIDAPEREQPGRK
jgi:RND family efflux transporter MFP subunit